MPSPYLNMSIGLRLRNTILPFGSINLTYAKSTYRNCNQLTESASLSTNHTFKEIKNQAQVARVLLCKPLLHLDRARTSLYERLGMETCLDLSAVHLPLGFPLNTFKLGNVVLLEPVHTLLLCSLVYTQQAAYRQCLQFSAWGHLVGRGVLRTSKRCQTEVPER